MLTEKEPPQRMGPGFYKYYGLVMTRKLEAEAWSPFCLVFRGHSQTLDEIESLDLKRKHLTEKWIWFSAYYAGIQFRKCSYRHLKRSVQLNVRTAHFVLTLSLAAQTTWTKMLSYCAHMLFQSTLISVVLKEAWKKNLAAHTCCCLLSCDESPKDHFPILYYRDHNKASF